MAVRKEDRRFGTGSFLKATGLSAPTMRWLCAAGIINPSVSDSGWRQFSEQDEAAAKAWKASRKVKRKA